MSQDSKGGTAKVLIGAGIGCAGIFAVVLLLICLPFFGLLMGIGGMGDDQNCSGGAGISPGAQDLKNGEVPKEYVDDVKDAAKTSGVPASVIAAQLNQESGFNPNAQSGAGAVGIGQFIPETWAKYSHGADPTDAKAGIRAQGEYMRDLMNIVGGTATKAGSSRVELALAAYNAGEGAVQQYQGIPPFSETQDYVKKITESAKSYKDATEGDEKSDESSSKDSEDSAADQGGGGQCGDSSGGSGDYSGGKTSGSDDFPWKDADTSSANPVSQFYFRQCVDFAMWRVNQQVGATDPNQPKFANNKGPWGHLGNGMEWAAAWKSGGWPADKKPEVGAVAHFDPGVTGAGDIGHVAVVKEIKGDQVVIEEYNAMKPFSYDTRTIPADGVSTYLHIPDSEKAK